MKRNDIQAKWRGRRSSAAVRKWFRPTLEVLEDRTLLSITVNTLADTFDGSITDGTISLRDAIAASPAGGTIDFSVSGTINLALGPVNVSDRIIDGPGAANLTIKAPNGSGSSVFITSGTTTLSGMTITGGNAVFGGGIRSDLENGTSDLTVVDSVITGNVARGGGGIYVEGNAAEVGSLTVLNTTISNNQAVYPGMVFPQYGRGGGIFGPYASVTVDKSTISGNYAYNYGGGIYGALVQMTSSTVSGNTTPRGGGYGDGLYVLSGTIANSTISGNQADGILVGRGGDVVVANSTITNNGYGVDSRGVLTLLNSIVAGNSGGTHGPDIDGPVNVSGSRNNLIGDAASAGGLTDGVNGNIVGVFDAGIGPLADNGGPTETCALYSYSPAINAGDNSLVPIDPATGLPYTTDQTGAPRIFNGGTVDMGAVEVQGTIVPSTVVNTTTDDVAPNNLTSLREAIGFASRSGGAVTFDPAVFATPQTIALVLGPITVDGTRVPVTITGPGADLTTVDAGGAPSVFVTHGTVTISGLTITGASFKPPTGFGLQLMPWGDGSTVPTSGQSLVIAGTDSNGLLHIRTFTSFGIRFDTYEAMEGGTLHLVSVDASGNVLSDSSESSLTAAQAQAMARLKQQLPGLLPPHVLTQAEEAQVLGEATVINRKPLPSSIYQSKYTGAIDNEEGALTVQDSQIAYNETRSILNQATLTVVNSIISGNQADNGGGIYSYVLGETPVATITNSIIDGNTAFFDGGGIYCNGTLTISNSTISNNSTLLSSVLFGDGGGVDDRGNNVLTVVNSTISGNSAGRGGGGVRAKEVAVLNSTISGNSAVSGGGLYTQGSTVFNSIIAGNRGGTYGGPDIDGPLNAASAYNLIGDAGSAGGLVNGVNGNIVGVDPRLGPLADNGGPTQTMALLPDSPAINAGSNALIPSGVTTDQRGFARVGGGTVDIGAYEVQTGQYSYAVTSTADDGSTGTLRDAINQVNAGKDNEIDFHIAGTGVQTINLTSQLPILTANRVYINGLSQGGSGNTKQLIELNGSGAGSSSDGLLLQGSNCIVSGLIVEHFNNGIEVAGANNTIGGTTTGAGNVLSGNSNDGLLIDSGVSGVTVQGNYIGTDVTGIKAQANSIGIEVAGNNNTIGGASGSRNLISGNTNDGVKIDSGASGNVVLGNAIGVNKYDLAVLANSGNGIEVAGSNNTVGASYAVAPNEISGNSNDGVLLDSSSSGNQVLGNYIGTNHAGTAAVANKVGIEDAGSSNTIGGSVLGDKNVISGNSGDGILLDSSATGEAVQGNYIGLNYNGKTALANGSNGVEVQGSNNLIGGNSASIYFVRNFISGNSGDGLLIATGATGNVVQGNFIGLDVSGTNGLGNSIGIEVAGTSNTLGGVSFGLGNVLSGNNSDGLRLDSLATNTVVQHNDVGTDYTGTSAVGNGGNGVTIGGNNNTLGGSVAAAGNIIAYNVGDGVMVSVGVGNTITSSSIFANSGGGISLSTGGNNNVAAPNPLTAVVTGSTLKVTGSFTAPTANVSYMLQFFANPSGDAEGKIYLGSLTVTPTSTGAQNFTFTAMTTVTGTYPLLAATLTDDSGDTSPFSNGVITS